MQTKKNLLVFAHKAEASAFTKFFSAQPLSKNYKNLQSVNIAINNKPWLKNFPHAIIVYCRSEEEINARIKKVVSFLGSNLNNIYFLGTAGMLNKCSLLGTIENTKANSYTFHIRHLVAQQSSTSNTMALSNNKFHIKKKTFLGASPMATAALISCNEDVVTTKQNKACSFYANLVDREFYFMAKTIASLGQSAFYIKTISDEANEQTNLKEVRAKASLFSKRLLKNYLQNEEELNSHAQYLQLNNKNGFQEFLLCKVNELINSYNEYIQKTMLVKFSFSQQKIVKHKLLKNFFQYFFKSKEYCSKNNTSPNLITLTAAFKNWQKKKEASWQKLYSINKNQNPQRRKALILNKI